MSIVLPTYLGFDPVHKKFHFFINVGGNHGRVLTYATYFFLDSWTHLPGTLDTTKPVPEEIINELEEYLSGKLHYEFAKRRKNSRTAEVRKIYLSSEAIHLPDVGVPQGDVCRKENNPDAGSIGKRTRRVGSNSKLVRKTDEQQTRSERREDLSHIPLLGSSSPVTETLPVKRKRKEKSPNTTLGEVPSVANSEKTVVSRKAAKNQAVPILPLIAEPKTCKRVEPIEPVTDVKKVRRKRIIAEVVVAAHDEKVKTRCTRSSTGTPSDHVSKGSVPEPVIPRRRKRVSVPE